MIYGIGTDIVEIERFTKVLARHGDRFVQRVFTQGEITAADTRPTAQRRIATFAKRFAAKEACAKALGTGFRDGLYLRDIAVENDAQGRPSLILQGVALQRLHGLMRHGHSPMLHLSLSDSEALAQAYVIIEGYPK